MTPIGEDEDEGVKRAMAEALDRDGKLYRKNGEFQATRVSVATPVETVLADGRKETRNVAAPGDFVVTGPGGERYVVKPEVFAARYERKRGARDVYFAHGEIIAVPNPLGRAIRFLASWGEVQTGAADCMIADMFDPATRKRAGQPYIIGRAEFEKTYSRVRPPSPTRF
jgi:PGDYG protein